MLSNTTFNNISSMLWWSGPFLGGAESNEVKYTVCSYVYLHSVGPLTREKNWSIWINAGPGHQFYGWRKPK
jgi:hypothetical protein